MTIAAVLAAVLLIAATLTVVLLWRSTSPVAGLKEDSAPPAGKHGATLPGEVSIPSHLYEPHLGHPRPAMPGLRAVDPLEASRAVAQRPAPHRPLSSRFALPDAVRNQLPDSADGVALVQTLLDVAGLEVHRDGDVLSVGDEVVVVVDAPIGELLNEHELNQAYLQFRSSGARRGVLVTPGLLDFPDVRRRERLDPRFGHAGLDGIQRMADAVAAGTDPLRVVARPAAAAVRRSGGHIVP